jgi:hypothetical protein
MKVCWPLAVIVIEMSVLGMEHSQDIKEILPICSYNISCANPAVLDLLQVCFDPDRVKTNDIKVAFKKAGVSKKKGNINKKYTYTVLIEAPGSRHEKKMKGTLFQLFIQGLFVKNSPTAGALELLSYYKQDSANLRNLFSKKRLSLTTANQKYFLKLLIKYKASDGRMAVMRELLQCQKSLKKFDAVWCEKESYFTG